MSKPCLSRVYRMFIACFIVATGVSDIPQHVPQILLMSRLEGVSSAHLRNSPKKIRASILSPSSISVFQHRLTVCFCVCLIIC